MFPPPLPSHAYHIIRTLTPTGRRGYKKRPPISGPSAKVPGLRIELTNQTQRGSTTNELRLRSGLGEGQDRLHLVVHNEHHGRADGAENVSAGALEQRRVT